MFLNTVRHKPEFITWLRAPWVEGYSKRHCIVILILKEDASFVFLVGNCCVLFLALSESYNKLSKNIPNLLYNMSY